MGTNNTVTIIALICSSTERTLSLLRNELSSKWVGILWSLELASEIFHDFFAYGIDGEEPGSALVTWAKFHKQHSRDRCAVGEEFGITEG